MLIYTEYISTLSEFHFPHPGGEWVENRNIWKFGFIPTQVYTAHFYSGKVMESIGSIV